MATKQGREQFSPVKKKFVSPISQRRTSKGSTISPKLRANLKDFHKCAQAARKGDLRPKRKLQKDKPISYQLGGNSHDPLNLNSLIDRDPAVNTPHSSPLDSLHGDSPVPVFLPKDCTDPLNLKGFPSQDGKEAIASHKKKKKKKKNKVIQNDILNKDGKEENQNDTSIESKGEEVVKKRRRRQKKKKSKKSKVQMETDEKNEVTEKSDAKIESEKIPEIEEKSNQHQQVVSEGTSSKKKGEQDSLKNDKTKNAQGHDVESLLVKDECEPPKKKIKIDSQALMEHEKEIMRQSESTDDRTIASAEHSLDQPRSEPCNQGEFFNTKLASGLKKKKQIPKARGFIHGNYNRYYGYRNANVSEDLRLKCFKKEWFKGKDILDIGCNVGDITIAIAQKFDPRVIVGSDIDNSLIKVAKNNIRKFMNQPVATANPTGPDFPISFSLTSGPIAAPVLPNVDPKTCRFPQNVVFKQENYVPPDERALSYQKPMYDTILCLSVTKWIHLNKGDEGLKLMFKRMFRNLRPGGHLILEPQPISSYRRKKNLTEKIRANYDNIKFRPEQFVDYLLSLEVGFAAFQLLDLPDHKQTGFKRPMYLFTKASSK